MNRKDESEPDEQSGQVVTGQFVNPARSSTLTSTWQETSRLRGRCRAAAPFASTSERHLPTFPSGSRNGAGTSLGRPKPSAAGWVTGETASASKAAHPRHASPLPGLCTLTSAGSIVRRRSGANRVLAVTLWVVGSGSACQTSGGRAAAVARTRRPLRWLARAPDRIGDAEMFTCFPSIFFADEDDDGGRLSGTVPDGRGTASPISWTDVAENDE